jgi:hypothetical protein
MHVAVRRFECERQMPEGLHATWHRSRGPRRGRDAATPSNAPTAKLRVAQPMLLRSNPAAKGTGILLRTIAGMYGALALRCCGEAMSARRWR